MTARRRRAAPGSLDSRIRLGVVVLLALLGFSAFLLVAPLSPGAVRVFELSLVWWFAGVLAPLLAVLTTVLSLWYSRRVRHD